MNKLARILIVALFVFPFSVNAAGANLGSGDGGKTAGSTHTASITVPVGTDLLVICALRTILDANTPAAPTSVTVGGVAATAVAAIPTGNQNTEWIKQYYFLSPSSGSQSIVVSGGGGTALDTGFEWSGYSGFFQSGQPDSSGKTDVTVTTALSVSTTVVASSWVIGCFGNGGGTPTSFTNGTQRVFAVPNNGAALVDSNGAIAPGSFTMTMNQANSTAVGLIVSYKLTATAATTPSFFSPMWW